MAQFNYTAIDAHGKKIKGSSEAESSFALAAQLKKQSITIIFAERIEEKGKRIKKDKIPGNSFFSLAKKITTEDLVIFYRQLSTMVDAGVQLVDSLEILADQAGNPTFQKVIQDVKGNIEAGESFSAALARHSHVFPGLGISMIKAAEIGGNLGSILDQLATYVEDKDKIDKKIKSAISYPKFILIFFGLVLSGVVFGLIPKFKDIFESFGADLPGITLVMIATSDFAKNNILYEIIMIIGLITGFKVFARSDWGRHFIDGFKFKIPVFGKMVVKSTIARFCKTLGTLTKNSVQLVDALTISAETANNVVIQEIVEDVKKNVTGGASLARSMQDHTIFPVMMVKMIAVGEQSGALEIMLEKVSEFYDRQFNSSIDGLTSIIEPVLMIGLGAIALIVVLAVYLPIFQMSGMIGE
ncbi:MAG: type II secretion system F family protein [Candidatus Marinimicrobia bacterium]|nr:type II secretion system F family protein [Candidatus Neomarinimicrobiota bacterium]